MTAVGERYRPSGRFEISGVLMSLLGGVIAAVVSAAVTFGWEISPIPSFRILTPIVQGGIVGGALYLLFGLAKLRHKGIALAIGAICGAITVVGLYYAHYHWFVLHQIPKFVRAHAPPE